MDFYVATTRSSVDQEVNILLWQWPIQLAKGLWSLEAMQGLTKDIETEITLQTIPIQVDKFRQQPKNADHTQDNFPSEL